MTPAEIKAIRELLERWDARESVGTQIDQAVRGTPPGYWQPLRELLSAAERETLWEQGDLVLKAEFVMMRHRAQSAEAQVAELTAKLDDLHAWNDAANRRANEAQVKLDGVREALEAVTAAWEDDSISLNRNIVQTIRTALATITPAETGGAG